MRKLALLIFAAIVGGAAYASSAPAPERIQKGEELQISSADVGQYGGTLVVGRFPYEP